MKIKKLKNILEAVLLGADRTLSVIQMEALFELDEQRPTRDEIRQALHEMAEDYETRGYELKQVASGFRLQVKQKYATWVGRLWEERPARYTRALLETMALIAYRQPVTRGEIEEVRGVSVSSNIIKTLLERDWIKVLGHKDVPGKPSLYGSTKQFLDYFNLKSLDQLPTLAEIKDLDSIHPELELDEDVKQGSEQTDPEQTEHNKKNDTDSLADENSVPVNEQGPVELSHTEEITENITENIVKQPAEEHASANDATEEPAMEDQTMEDQKIDDHVTEDQATEVTVTEELMATEKQIFNV